MTKKLFLHFLVSMFFLASVCFTSIFLYTQVYSNSSSDKEQSPVLISEIKPSGGTGKTTDEYVELFNPNSTSVDISEWVLARQTKTASSTDWQTMVIFSSSTVLSGYGHLLVAHIDYIDDVLADISYSGNSISDDNTLILFDNKSKVIDLVGYGKANNNETANAVAPTNQFLSIERLPGGVDGNSQDTNNNLVDFVRAIPTPQSLVSEPKSIPNPVLTIINTQISTSTSIIQTSTSTIPTSTIEFVSSSISNTHTEDDIQEIVDDFLQKPLIPAMGSILITEFLPIPTSTQVEFVELYNRTSQEVSLADWWLQDGGDSKTVLSGVILPQHYLVIEKPKGNLNNSGDSIRLVAFDGSIIDQVVYGDWDDGTLTNNASEPKLGASLVRPNENFDSNNDQIDFVLTEVVTPGAKNQVKTDQIQNTINPVSGVNTINNVETTVVKDPTVKTLKETKIEKKDVLRIKIVTDKTVDYGEPIIFDASETVGTDDISYVWEMGDGMVLEGESVDYVYRGPGYYIITLTATDSTGRKIKKVKVQVREPVKKKSNDTETRTVAGYKKIKEDNVSKIDKSVFVPIHALPEIKSNTTVSITGLVAAEPDSYGRKKEFYVTDESKAGFGIRIVFQKERPAIIRGDQITVTGKYTVKKDESYIILERTDFLVVLRHENDPVPQVEKIGGLIQLAGGLVRISGEITDVKKDYAYIDDSTGEIKINGLKKQKVALNDIVDIIGVLLQSKDGFELYPRAAEDITVHALPKETQKESDIGVSLGPFWKKYAIWFGFGLILFAFFIKKIIMVGKKIKPTNDTFLATAE
ncbi:MAG: hypothetical protein A2983_03995 [Candidatus Magasanikbacteria bacterium RIFCSPLOWO2_01_FULL_40_15]|uniref:PKD domain-containing protein n=1 Tax=Candidatus Magasanikbacteria bacterium RIFCSPLOWO2_01_FULL_40_15 TaxID=1798686 RepID=A0A1F6N036_9BACT|nr:MAG: hypothetical protein A2983_03995 [Candidatus Magasanikbacteria bacterium RIFCSPLOWO2_01_FULL_40_15]